MITRLEIDGFKTFTGFRMEFTPFTVIAGSNASGKSNIFDVLKLLSNLAHQDLRTAFNNLRGDAEEQFTQFANGKISKKITISMEMLLDKKIKDNWGEEANIKYTRLRYEIIIERRKNVKGFEDLNIVHEQLLPLKHQEDDWIKQNINKEFIEHWRPKVKTGKRGKPYILTEQKNGANVIKIPLDGKPGPGREFLADEIAQSALSSVNSVEYPHVFAAKQEMLNWQLLQLNPEELRKPSARMSPDKITHSGANLAAALFRLKSEDESILNDISIELNNLLPHFTKVKVEEEKAENRFLISLKSEDGRWFSSNVLSEGTLRILILCILKYDDKHKGVICFEEPENGIHPFRLSLMIQLLKGLSTEYSEIDYFSNLRQIIVNTHSPGFVKNGLEENRGEISVWFSKLVSKISKELNCSFKVSKLVPVKNSYGQTALSFLNKSEIEMTDLEVKKYLESEELEI